MYQPFKLVILQYNRDINQCIFLLYNKTVEYKEFQETLTNVHIDNNKYFQNITNEISQVIKTTQEWDNYFDQVNNVIAEREKSKDVFEHYENKVIRLQKQLNRGESDFKKLQRVYAHLI
jgi:hypothetical protein